MRQAVGSAKKVNNEEQVRKVEPVRCKVALPYIEYRSATPLKFVTISSIFFFFFFRDTVINIIFYSLLGKAH